MSSIAAISRGRRAVSTGALRAAGFKAAAAPRQGCQRKIPPSSRAPLPAAAGTAGCAAACSTARMRRPPSLPSNDLLALGIYDALAARGLNCPADVSVVGHNLLLLTLDMLSPPLTTVRIAQREIVATRAARLLLDAIAAPPRDPSA